MLKFNELRIDRDKNLIIDFQIMDVNRDYYDSISIEHINVGVGSTEHTIDYIDYWGGIGPNCEFEWVDDREYDPDPTATGDTITVHRGFRLKIGLSGLWTSDEEYKIQEAYRYLVYVNITVAAQDDRAVMTDCLQESEATAFAYDRCLIVDTVFDYIKSTANPCTDLSNYANYIVQIKGLEIAIESGNFTLANKFWNKFFFNNRTPVTSNCCCR